MNGERNESAQVLEHAKGFLRSQLSQRINLFRTPELHFEYDESLERGMNLTHLIDQATAQAKESD